MRPLGVTYRSLARDPSRLSRAGDARSARRSRRAPHRDMVTHPSHSRSVLIVFGPRLRPVANGTDCPAPRITTFPALPGGDGWCRFAADPGLDRSLRGLPAGQNQPAESAPFASAGEGTDQKSGANRCALTSHADRQGGRMLQREIETRLDRPCRSAEALGGRKAP
jgi:hypothetical protein